MTVYFPTYLLVFSDLPTLFVLNKTLQKEKSFSFTLTFATSTNMLSMNKLETLIAILLVIFLRVQAVPSPIINLNTSNSSNESSIIESKSEFIHRLIQLKNN
jgi:hypothetical protein